MGMTYLFAAFAVVWVGLFLYLFVITLRMRGVQTELAATTELVREHQERVGLQKDQILNELHALSQVEKKEG